MELEQEAERRGEASGIAKGEEIGVARTIEELIALRLDRFLTEPERTGVQAYLKSQGKNRLLRTIDGLSPHDLEIWLSERSKSHL